MADGCLAAGRCRRGAVAADALRAAQGLRAAACGRSSSSTRSTGPTPGPSKCSTRSSTCSSSWTPTTPRSISRPSTPPAAQGIATTDLAVPADRPAAAVRRHPEARAGAGGRPGRAAADAGHHARLQRLRRPHRHRPGLRRQDPQEPAHRPAASTTAAQSTTPSRSCYVFDRLGRIETDEVGAGDICAVVGLDDVDIGDTIADFDNPVALPPIKVDEPTLDMVFRINDSPFAGQDGNYVTSRQLRDRLMKELQSNVALRVAPERGQARRVPRLRPRPAAPGDPAREHAPRRL